MGSENSYFSIGLSIGGRVLARIGLSRVEYQTIKSVSFDEAIHRIIQKEPLLKKDIVMTAAIVNHIQNGNFRVRQE